MATGADWQLITQKGRSTTPVPPCHHEPFSYPIVSLFSLQLYQCIYTACKHFFPLVAMFRTPPTRVLLSDYEIFQTIHTICTQRLKALSLAYGPPLSEEDEDESKAEFHQISLSTSYTRSSSVQPEDDRWACDVLDTNIYISSSKSDSDDLTAYSAESHTLLNAHSTNSGETYQSEGTSHDRRLAEPTLN